MAGNPNMVKGGPSLNPLGRPKGRFRPLTDAIRMELIEDPKRARRIARRLLQEAEDGNLQAASLLMDRLEGKAIQQIEMGDPGSFMSQEEVINRTVELQEKLFKDEAFLASMQRAQGKMVEEAVEVPRLPTTSGVKVK